MPGFSRDIVPHQYDLSAEPVRRLPGRAKLALELLKRLKSSSVARTDLNELAKNVAGSFGLLLGNIKFGEIQIGRIKGRRQTNALLK